MHGFVHDARNSAQCTCSFNGRMNALPVAQLLELTEVNKRQSGTRNTHVQEKWHYIHLKQRNRIFYPFQLKLM